MGLLSIRRPSARGLPPCTARSSLGTPAARLASPSHRNCFRRSMLRDHVLAEQWSDMAVIAKPCSGQAAPVRARCSTTIATGSIATNSMQHYRCRRQHHLEQETIPLLQQVAASNATPRTSNTTQSRRQHHHCNRQHHLCNRQHHHCNRQHRHGDRQLWQQKTLK